MKFNKNVYHDTDEELLVMFDGDIEKVKKYRAVEREITHYFKVALIPYLLFCIAIVSNKIDILALYIVVASIIFLVILVTLIFISVDKKRCVKNEK